MPDIPMPDPVKTVGIDVGLIDYATFSDTTLPVPAPKFFRKGQRKLRKAQRTVSRRQKGSKRKAKAARKAAIVHQKFAIRDEGLRMLAAGQAGEPKRAGRQCETWHAGQLSVN